MYYPDQWYLWERRGAVEYHPWEGVSFGRYYKTHLCLDETKAFWNKRLLVTQKNINTIICWLPENVYLLGYSTWFDYKFRDRIYLDEIWIVCEIRHGRQLLKNLVRRPGRFQIDGSIWPVIETYL